MEPWSGPWSRREEKISSTWSARSATRSGGPLRDRPAGGEAFARVPQLAWRRRDRGRGTSAQSAAARAALVARAAPSGPVRTLQRSPQPGRLAGSRLSRPDEKPSQVARRRPCAPDLAQGALFGLALTSTNRRQASRLSVIGETRQGRQSERLRPCQTHDGHAI